jgi:hypothetical protein
MQMTGQKTRSVFEGYNIVSASDLRWHGISLMRQRQVYRSFIVVGLTMSDANLSALPVRFERLVRHNDSTIRIPLEMIGMPVGGGEAIKSSGQ